MDEFTSTGQDVHEQNNLHAMKTTELDETNALPLFPNESQLFPKQITELGLPYSCGIIVTSGEGRTAR